MHPFILCHNGRDLQLKSTSVSQDLGPVSRICATEDEIYLLSHGIVFQAQIPTENDNNELSLDIMFRNIVDMDMWEERFYIVDIYGLVRSRNPDLSWTEISFDPLEIAEERIRINRVKCNSLGAVFVTDKREVYAMGVCGELFNCQLPIRLKSFDKPILDVSSGDDFFIVIVENEYCDKEGEHFGRNSQRTASNRPGNSSRLERCSENSLSSRESDAAMCLEDNIQDILRCGYALLHTTVCSFGASNNGVLGTGDHIKRPGINHVLNLCEIGVCAISTGREHSIARTIDGRLFHWGLNSRQQLQNGKHELSSPAELRLDTVSVDSIESHVLEACCGDYRTVLLKLNGERLEKDNGEITQRQLLAMHVSNVPQNIPLILTARDFTLYNDFTFQQAYYQFLLSLQQCLHLCQRGRAVIRSLQALQKSQQQFTQICQNYLQVLYTLFACCKSLESFYRGDSPSFKEILWLRNAKEVIKIFEDYTKSYCDLKSVNGFGQSSQASFGVESAPKEMLEHLFTHPFGQISNFVKLLETLAQNQSEEPASNELNEKLLLWQEFSRQSRIDIELAEHTYDFWLRNEKNMKIRPFMKKHRRVILAPTTVPLKWYSGVTTLGTNCFILFSDCLCQYAGTSLHTYPLVAVWVKKESESRLKIITPEKSFSLEAKNHEDKVLWYDQLESSIMSALGRPGGKLSNVRTTAYVFSSKHPKYAKVHAYGRWKNGIMHGKCYLEYPDGKFYFGDVRNGEIEGHGKMAIPSVGVYEGNFKAGKFHGYGCFEMNNNEVYDGNFRDGLFHGHGLLRTNTYTYVGDYQFNSKSGYGILDDMISGDKYMGMFADNKRVGAGTCITMNGDYFEGIFVNDELTGQGIAVFENDYYFEGELTMHGPAGKGTYYMPHGTIDGDGDDDDATKCNMIGNVISGHLSGTWNDVRVITGSVAINRNFPKFPKSIGELVVDNSRKWRNLFDNFEEQIFGSNDSTSSTKLLWNRIAVFMTNQKNREKNKDLENIPSSTHYFAKNISMGYSSSLDKISLKSMNSLLVPPSAKASYLDLTSDESQPKKSYSQETLNDSWDGLQYDISFNEDNLLSSSFLNAQLECWATDSLTSTSTRSSIDSTTIHSTLSNGLEFVPSFGVTSLTDDDVTAIKEYLGQAFKDPHHPLHLLNQKIANCFCTSYGSWKVKPTPILAKQAMQEWESFSKRVYNFVRRLFPALPEDFCSTDGSREVISHISLLYPIVLSEGIYSILFVLYAHKYSRKDEQYRQNLMYVDKLSDKELAKILSLDESHLVVVSNAYFHDAIAMLKQLQKKYSPKAMLNVIERSVELITEAHKYAAMENSVILAADSMMPLALFLVLRAGVPHLGAELALLDDLTGGSNFQSEMSGLAGYCYTTIKAAYEHITSNQLSKS
ncbi:alsin homolog [Episyrphus balteatus]|uniref:alsin homolog n=1 Tax=Episyrphus balteatus TaxID=286459 RepID=UPI002486427D|nr:alsin homolog [Episyrphus balteatus]